MIQPQYNTGLYATRAEKLQTLGLDKNGRMQSTNTSCAGVANTPAVNANNIPARSSDSGDDPRADFKMKRLNKCAEGKTKVHIQRMDSAQKAFEEAGFETSEAEAGE